MKTKRLQLVRLRAACAVLGLLIGCLSASAALAVNSPDVCSMACCVKEGHCCCSPRHASVRGETSGGRNQISGAEVGNSCPEGCATPLFSKSPARESARTAIHSVDEVAAGLIYLHAPAPATKTIESSPSSPRGPPSLLTNQIA